MSAAPPPPATSSPADIRRGALLALLACLLFSLNDALGKWLVADFPVGQLLLLRSIAALAVLSPSIWRAGVWRTLRADPPGLHLLRAILFTAEVAAFYWAVRYLPLADVVAFYMACPLFVAVLARIILGERVGAKKTVAIVIGFGGVLLILRPTEAALTLPALIALAGSALFAAALVTTRFLRAASGLTFIAWQTLGAGLAGAATVPFAWVSGNAIDLLLLASLGFAATGAHMCNNRALQLAPAGIVAPIQYSLMVFAIILGYLVFGDVPDLQSLAGAALIVACGWYVTRSTA
ncbi:MAG: DMT family transporter [Alphaproteobacteria bacterium]|nr:DMT family transporter [Alphaproteobacteria bacterium]